MERLLVQPGNSMTLQLPLDCNTFGTPPLPPAPTVVVVSTMGAAFAARRPTFPSCIHTHHREARFVALLLPFMKAQLPCSTINFSASQPPLPCTSRPPMLVIVWRASLWSSGVLHWNRIRSFYHRGDGEGVSWPRSKSHKREGSLMLDLFICWVRPGPGFAQRLPGPGLGPDFGPTFLAQAWSLFGFWTASWASDHFLEEQFRCPITKIQKLICLTNNCTSVLGHFQPSEHNKRHSSIASVTRN